MNRSLWARRSSSTSEHPATPAGATVGAFALLVALVAPGCDRARPSINGLAGFEIGKTMLADMSGQARCYINPGTDAQRCMVLPATSIAGRRPEVQLDFDGKTPQSTVSEITLTIPGCSFDAVRTWLDERLGSASEVADKRAYWSQKRIFVAAEESGPARCYVTAVAPSNQARVARLKRSGQK